MSHIKKKITVCREAEMASNEPTPRREERPIARIPWIPVKMSEVKPEDNKFFQEMMSSGEEGARRLEFYRILNKAFPFYLPKRYFFNILLMSIKHD